MSYATLADVQARDPSRTYTASSVPNATQVGMFILDTAAELDGILSSLQYAVPVSTSATVALGMLRGFNALGANCLVQEAAPTSRDRDQARELWEDCKKALRAGDIVLPDASADSGGLPLGPGSGGIGSAREAWFGATLADIL